MNNSVGGNHTDAGAVARGGHNNAASAHPSSVEDAMAESIVTLLSRLAAVEAERDYYKGIVNGAGGAN